ncbi:MAG TPA: alpha-ketoacid dehydrogenase subunit beta [Candidatus Paceibacterota bacterium]
MVDALNMALAYEMRVNKHVVVLGEDIGVNGGVFRVTDGLLKKFGRERVLDTPLSETLIVGMSIGMASQGLRPVAEIQFSGFVYPGFDQIVNHASRLRNRTRGVLTCPMVVRMPSGGGIHAPEHHSESVEAFFTHVPGLRVVIPSSPKRAYGLLLASIRDPDPVIFLEPTRLYRLGKEVVEDTGEALPLDRCFVLREGKDVTLVSWGASIHETLLATDALLKEGVSAEVIDVATLKYLDEATILQSVKKTGRLVVIHEAPEMSGFGAEIMARVLERGLYFLLSPPRRIAGFNCVMPLYRLEEHYIPSVERIVAEVRELLAAS